jgi:hypothetical protein
MADTGPSINASQSGESFLVLFSKKNRPSFVNDRAKARPTEKGKKPHPFCHAPRAGPGMPVT